MHMSVIPLWYSHYVIAQIHINDGYSKYYYTMSRNKGYKEHQIISILLSFIQPEYNLHIKDIYMIKTN